MSTQILPAYYTTTNLRRRKTKPKVTGQESKHDLWLRKKGVHPDQLKAKKTGVEMSSSGSMIRLEL